MAALSDSNFIGTTPFLAASPGKPTLSADRVRFGSFELDTRAGELRHGEHKIVLPDQPHKILLMLIERPGEIVTRDEIQKRLWADGVIVSFEVSINQAIRKLRRALNDSAEDSKYVETIGRRGYRLKQPVETANGQAHMPASLPAGTRLAELIGDEKGIAFRAEDLKVLSAALGQLMKVLEVLESSTARRAAARPHGFQPRLVRHWK